MLIIIIPIIIIILIIKLTLLKSVQILIRNILIIIKFARRKLHNNDYKT